MIITCVSFVFLNQVWVRTNLGLLTSLLHLLCLMIRFMCLGMRLVSQSQSATPACSRCHLSSCSHLPALLFAIKFRFIFQLLMSCLHSGPNPPANSDGGNLKETFDSFSYNGIYSHLCSVYLFYLHVFCKGRFAPGTWLSTKQGCSAHAQFMLTYWVLCNI